MTAPVSGSVDEALAQGNLAGALRMTKELVQRQPGRVELRARLFQLFCVQGDWARARTQLDLIAELESNDAETVFSIPVLRGLMEIEQRREEIASGRAKPVIFGEPPEWIAVQLEGVRHLGEGRMSEGVAYLRQALEEGPTLAGRIDDHGFACIQDADARFGGVVEAVLQGRYFWVPFASLREIKIQRPENLHEKLWLSATVTLANGAELPAHLPARYPGSTTSQDDSLMLGATTEWKEIGPGAYMGMGQRFWATEQADHAIRHVRRIVLEDSR